MSPAAILALGIGLLLLSLYTFGGEILLAAVFAFGLKRPFRWLRTKIPLSQRWSGALALLLLFTAILVPATFLGLRAHHLATNLIREGGGSSGNAGTLSKATVAYERITGRVAEFGTRFHLFDNPRDAANTLQASLKNAGTRVANALSRIFLSLPDTVVSSVVFFLFLYAFLAHSSEFGSELARLRIMRPGHVARMAKILEESSYRAIVTNTVVGAIQASAVTLGAWLCGFGESILIFLTVFVLSFIPFIGAAPVAFLLAAIGFIGGDTGAGAGMIVTGVIAGTIDNVVRPYLISNGDNEVHPALSFAAILGSIAIFGLKGLFFGPVILTATFALLQNGSGAEESAPPLDQAG